MFGNRRERERYSFARLQLPKISLQKLNPFRFYALESITSMWLPFLSSSSPFLLAGILLLLLLNGVVSAPPPPPLRDPIATAEDLHRLSSFLKESTPSRSLSTYDHRENQVLIASLDGTFFLMDPRSNKIQWKLSTGSPLLYSEQPLSAIDKKLDISIMQLVHETPVINGSMVTLGSKTTSLYHVRADTGELLYREHLPVIWPSFKASVLEGKTNLPVLDVDRSALSANWIITIVRTDYFVNSSNLGKPLWSISNSTLTASLTMITDNNIELSPLQQVDIPVYICNISKPQLQPMLPDKSYGSQESSLMAIIARNEPNTEDHAVQILGDYKCAPLFGNVCEEENSDDVEKNVGDRFPFINNQNPIQLIDENRVLFRSSQYSSGSAKTIKLIFFEMLQQISHYILLLSVILSTFILFFLLSSYLLSQTTGAQPMVPKKRKVRKGGSTKNGAIISNHDKGSAEFSEAHIRRDQNPFTNLRGSGDASDGRWVGRLFVSNSEIGRGSNGTVVLQGVYDGRPVAVKRLLRAHHDVAFKEIQNLIASDQHPNIVRWYGVEQDIDFVYISLERCKFSLSDLIQLCSGSSSDPLFTENPSLNSIKYHKVQLEHEKVAVKDHCELWTVNGFPSSQLLKLMRDVVCGLVHLHELGIIHRDLKPQNVLVSNDRFLNAKLSDMGISKRLLEDMSSLSHHATGHGSSGWQAPEQLLHGRQTRAVDLFSLGCIVFFCITKGKHPFGNYYERDSNIINNRVDLFLVDHMPEAVHLLSQLLDVNPKMRPTAVEVLHHPLFWNSETRLSFLRDASDRVELEDREGESELLKALEDISTVAFGGKWGEKLGAAFVADMGRYRKYKFDCTRDLLRVIRNKLNHYRELPKILQENLGPVPEGFDGYFSMRFPKLLIEVYKVVSIHCREECGFSKYFNKSIV